jgi:two-component sensor histidine kinase
MKKMFFKARYYILAFLLLEAVAFAFSLNYRRGLEGQYFSNEIHALQLQYRSIIHSYSHASRLVFEEVINKPGVAKILQGVPAAGEAERRALREKLFLRLSPTYQTLKKNNMKDLQFYLPDGTIFLRLQNPSRFGDKNRDEACPVRDSIKTREYSEGFEICNVYSGYKFAFPLFYGGSYKGSVLMGITMDAFEDEMEDFFTKDFSFIVRKDIVEGEIFSSAGDMLDTLKDSYRGTDLSDGHYLYSAGYDQAGTVREINGRIKGRATERLEGGESFALPAKVDGNYHLAVFIPISGAEAEAEGHMIAYGGAPMLEVFEKEFYFNLAFASLFVLVLTASAYRINEGRRLLEKSNVKLSESYREVELKVNERTAELDKTNKELENEIAERKKAEELIAASLREKEVLLKEIHHRVKNNLAIISALLQLQAGNSTDENVTLMFRESQSRIHSMALVHRKLYETTDFTNINFREYVEDLVGHLLRTYGTEGSGISLALSIDDINPDIDTTISCGLIINELVTNSLKHAFENIERPEIGVSFKAYDGHATLVYGDNGRGIPEHVNFLSGETLGLQLVNMLANQLGGSIELERNDGIRVTIKFELAA